MLVEPKNEEKKYRYNSTRFPEEVNSATDGAVSFDTTRTLGDIPPRPLFHQNNRVYSHVCYLSEWYLNKRMSVCV